MSVEVGVNRFFVKNIPTVGINITPRYRDIPLSTDETFTLGTASAENYFILSGQAASPPRYGDGSLVGGLLSLYAYTGNVADNRHPPQLRGYMLNKNTTLKEGAFSLAHKSGSTAQPVVGDKIAVYGSNPANDIPYLSESFEGNPSEFTPNLLNRQGNSNIVTLGDPYISSVDLFQMVKEWQYAGLTQASFDLNVTSVIYYNNVPDKYGGNWVNPPGISNWEQPNAGESRSGGGGQSSGGRRR